MNLAMKSLSDVFVQFGGLAQGGGPSAAVNIDQLKGDLAQVEQRNRLYLLICVGMMLFLFVVLVVVVLLFLNNAGVVQVALGAFGVSCAGLIRWMVALWREKYYLEVLLATASNLGAKDVRAVISILRNRWSGQK